MSLPSNIFDAYADIDINDDGYICTSELRRWLRRHDSDEAKIETFITQVDEDQSGTITIETWCTLHNTEIGSCERANDPLPADITVIASDMKLGAQNSIVRIVREEMKDSKSTKDSAKAIKSSLDRRLERLWHVVVVKGQYWAYYSHEPAASLVFSMAGFIYVIWKTPGY